MSFNVWLTLFCVQAVSWLIRGFIEEKIKFQINKQFYPKNINSPKRGLFADDAAHTFSSTTGYSVQFRLIRITINGNKTSSCVPSYKHMIHANASEEAYLAI
jgi:hypothetical protein